MSGSARRAFYEKIQYGRKNVTPEPPTAPPAVSVPPTPQSLPPPPQLSGGTFGVISHHHTFFHATPARHPRKQKAPVLLGFSNKTEA